MDRQAYIRRETNGRIGTPRLRMLILQPYVPVIRFSLLKHVPVLERITDFLPDNEIVIVDGIEYDRAQFSGVNLSFFVEDAIIGRYIYNLSD